MIRKHDRYVLRMYWGTFLAVVLFFTSIVLVLDLSERYSRFNRQWEAVQALGFDPLALILEFYASRVAFVWLRILPFCVPIAAAFCLARLIRHNELSALLASGVPLRRIVAPIVLSGVVIAGLMVVAQSTVISELSRRHMRLGRILGKRSPDRVSRVPHFHDPSGVRLSMDAFMPLKQRMEAAWITRWGPDGVAEIRWYPELVWNAEARAWLAPRGGERIPMDTGGALGARRTPIPAGEPAPLAASLALIETSLTLTGNLGLTFREARALAEANPENPGFVQMWHQLIVVPVSTIVLLLLTLPFVARVDRRGRGALPGMLAALVLGALFFGAGYLCSGLAGAGDVNPVVLAWLPTVVFASLGASLYLGLDG